MLNKHCLHRRDNTVTCCHCGTNNEIKKEWVATPDPLHGPYDPSGHNREIRTELSECIVWSWRDLSGEPCSECEDTGVQKYIVDSDWGDDYVRESACSCRNHKSHPWYENGSLNKCRRCQLPKEHDIHN